MTTPRPICGHCGQAYGQRATTNQIVRWKEGETKPEYRGNGIVLKEHLWKSGASHGTIEGVPFAQNENVLHRYVWDGETWWGGYKPFCTLRCALDYARKQWKRGHR